MLIDGETADELPQAIWAAGADGDPYFYTRSDDDGLRLRCAYNNICRGDPEFLTLIGLSPDASWPEFRAHYDRGGQADIDSLFGDWDMYRSTPANTQVIEDVNARLNEIAADAANREEQG